MRQINGKIRMPGRVSLALGLLAATLGVAAAAPLPAQPDQPAEQSLVSQVKGGKQYHHHHHNRWGGVGTVIVLGTGYCAARAATCEDRYGGGTYGYWRCLRRAGCD